MSETIKLPPDLLLRDRAERAEAERDALRADAERYRWLRTARDWGFWCCHGKDGEGGQILKYGADLDAAIDAALEKDKSVTAPPIWETLAEIGESAPAGTWDALPTEIVERASMTLPYDTARCPGTDHAICQLCRRREPGHHQWQVTIAPPIDRATGECSSFIAPIKGLP